MSEFNESIMSDLSPEAQHLFMKLQTEEMMLQQFGQSLHHLLQMAQSQIASTRRELQDLCPHTHTSTSEAEDMTFTHCMICGAVLDPLVS